MGREPFTGMEWMTQAWHGGIPGRFSGWDYGAYDYRRVSFRGSI